MALISSEKALQIVANLDDQQLQNSISEALLDQRPLPTGVRGDDQPEDLFLALLETPRRASVINGWITVMATIAPYFFTDPLALPLSYREGLYHLMALIDIAHPPELQQQTQSFLQLVLREDISKELRNPVVRAALGYARSEGDLKFWEPLVSGNLVPAYAFKALLKINPNARRIETCLVDFWRRKLEGTTNINVASLTMDARDARNDGDHVVRRVLARLMAESPELQDPLIAELKRYTWSEDWVEYIFQPRTSHLRVQTSGLRRSGAPESHSEIIRTGYDRVFDCQQHVSGIRTTNRILIPLEKKIIQQRIHDTNRGQIMQGILVITSEDDLLSDMEVSKTFSNIVTLISEPSFVFEAETYHGR